MRARGAVGRRGAEARTQLDVHGCRSDRPDVALDRLEHVLGTLRGHEPARDAGVRHRRDRRHQTICGVAGVDRVQLQRRPEGGALPGGPARVAHERAQVERRSLGRRVPAGRCEPLPLGGRDRDDVVGKPVDGDRAVRVMHARDDLGEDLRGVRDGAAVLARVRVDPGAPHDQLDVAEAPRPEHHAGRAGEGLGAVGRDREVAAKQLAMCLQDGSQPGREDLLLALEQHLHVERERALGQQALERDEHRDERPLHVRRTAPVHRVAADDGRERRARPVRLVDHRLHVVVPVQEDRRPCPGHRASRRRPTDARREPRAAARCAARSSGRSWRGARPPCAHRRACAGSAEMLGIATSGTSHSSGSRIMASPRPDARRSRGSRRAARRCTDARARRTASRPAPARRSRRSA